MMRPLSLFLLLCAEAASATPADAPTVAQATPSSVTPSAASTAEPTAAPAQPSRTLSLEEALQTATSHQPQLRQAQANTQAAEARVDQRRSSLLPQVNSTLTYQRSTSGTTGTSTPTTGISVRNNGFTLGATASQLLYDFGQTTGRWRAAQSSAEAQASTGEQTRLDVLANVRTAYFNVLAQQALLQVARETLANEESHLNQVQAQVEVGTRPEIDLLQQKTSLSNARLQLIQSQNAYATSKAQLNQAMGVKGSTDYAVQDVTVAPVEGEDQPTDALVTSALSRRPDLAASASELRAQQQQLSATRGGYWPSLSASLSGSDVGEDPSQTQWNLTGQLALSWPLFQGGLTRAQVREQEATLSSLQAQRDSLQQQARLQVESAQLSVRAARESLSAAEDALANARERLRLAEGRYQAGVGNIIELGDAQVQATNAAAQRVQAVYQIATARTELARALGLVS
ncbi:TolC family protein [Hyalangium versicolor]|uniref:TolC family protein n=1 Tax=Hyalangium versicolor TaxID=2861190 RepID=UPI001CCA3BDE|nr:TolC family protein [Hyalangium versicolor]